MSPAASANPDLSANNASTVAEKSDGHIISDEERWYYYLGISRNLPSLLWRSDYTTVPFVASSGHFPSYPVKTLLGVHGTRLNSVWHDVVAKIMDYLDGLSVQYSSIQPARFVTKDDSTGVVVFWISTPPGTTTAATARDVTPRILLFLQEYGVQDVNVEWFESSIVPLRRPPLPGPHLFKILRRFTRFLAPLIGMPIGSTAEDGKEYGGTLALFFREGQDQQGRPSSRVLGVTARHVLGEGRGGPKPTQPILVASDAVFKENVERISEWMTATEHELGVEASCIKDVQLNLHCRHPEEVQKKYMSAYNSLRLKHDCMKEDIDDLGQLKDSLTADHWDDPQQRIIGTVDWAPDVAVDANTSFTLDLATVVLEPEMFPNFRGNVIDLGFKIGSYQFAKIFERASEAGNPTLPWPAGGFMMIKGYVPREELDAVPNAVDAHKQRCFIVLKNGARTDVTIGRLAGVHGYLHLQPRVKSEEIVIYGYSRDDRFVDEGDSGALVVDGRGRMVGIIHAGHSSGLVAYATPAWWIIQQLQNHYRGADFDITTF